jgi:hypothetical protein
LMSVLTYWYVQLSQVTSFALNFPTDIFLAFIFPPTLSSGYAGASIGGMCNVKFINLFTGTDTNTE